MSDSAFGMLIVLGVFFMALIGLAILDTRKEIKILEKRSRDGN